MKKILFLFFFFPPLQFLFAQDWPVGTTWVYEQDDFNTPDTTNFVIFKIVGDTLIQNQAVKILKEYPYYHSTNPINSLNYFQTYFIKTENQKVSLWEKDSSKFLQIYDFNLQINDLVEWYVGPFKDITNDTLLVHYLITSIDTVRTSGSSKRKYSLQKLDPEKCYSFRTDEIIEDIGSPGYFFQIRCAVDPSPGGKLRCFSNGTINYPDGADCKLPTGLQELIDFKPTIYPNPSKGFFSIHGLDLSDYSIEFYNQLGQQFFVTTNENKFDMSQVKTGMYILKLKNKTKSIIIKINKV